MLILYKVLVLPLLKYCSPLKNPSELGQIKKGKCTEKFDKAYGGPLKSKLFGKVAGTKKLFL